MSDLTAFLLARLDDIEREAKSKPLDWLYINGLSGASEMVDLGPGWALVTDPAHVLADVQAKRAIVEEAGEVSTLDDGSSVWMAAAAHANRWLRHLAAIYADHPDYREEWRS